MHAVHSFSQVVTVVADGGTYTRRRYLLEGGEDDIKEELLWRRTEPPFRGIAPAR
jgi:hypothetical protein